MADFQLNVTVEERDYLVQLLDWALKESKVEEHRTRSPSFREHILHREEVIAAILKKISHPTK